MAVVAKIFANPLLRYYRDLVNNYLQSGISNTARLLPGAIVKNSKLEEYSSVGHDAAIINASLGRYSYVSAGARVANCEIGPFCSIGNNVVIAPGIHPVSLISTHPIFFSNSGQCGDVWVDESVVEENRRVQIGADVWIGVNAIVLDGVSIGVGAIIGAGSVVTKDVPPYAVVAGAPAKLIKFRFNSDVIEGLIRSEWWRLDPEILKENRRVFLENPEIFLEWIASRVYDAKENY